jgi:hypothetical protein
MTLIGKNRMPMCREKTYEMIIFFPSGFLGRQEQANVGIILTLHILKAPPLRSTNRPVKNPSLAVCPAKKNH